MQEDIDRLTGRGLEVGLVLHRVAWSCAQRQQSGVNHEGLSIGCQDRLVLFRLGRTAQHLEAAFAKYDARLDQQPLARSIQQDRAIRIERHRPFLRDLRPFLTIGRRQRWHTPRECGHRSEYHS